MDNRTFINKVNSSNGDKSMGLGMLSEVKMGFTVLTGEHSNITCMVVTTRMVLRDLTMKLLKRIQVGSILAMTVFTGDSMVGHYVNGELDANVVVMPQTITGSSS